MFDLNIKIQFGTTDLTIENYDWITKFEFELNKTVLNEPTEKTLEEFTEKIRQSIERNLFTGQTWYGVPVEPLAPRTIQKKKHSKVFFDTGELYQSVMKQKIPNGYEIFIKDSRSQIAYWLQTGTSKMPARPFLGVIPERADSLLNDIITNNYK